jgi:hypothetical protein
LKGKRLKWPNAQFTCGAGHRELHVSSDRHGPPRQVQRLVRPNPLAKPQTRDGENGSKAVAQSGYLRTMSS